MRIPFEGRYERARELQKEKKAQRERKLGRDIEPADMMEKGDGLAMLLAALVTIVPICLIVIAVLAAVGYFFVVR